MAIQALYPSRQQSRWHNPLFVRAWRRRAIALVSLGGLGFALSVGLRLIPGDAAAQALPAINKPVAVPIASMSIEPKRKVRVIHLYSIPNDQLTAVPGKA